MALEGVALRAGMDGCASNNGAAARAKCLLALTKATAKDGWEFSGSQGGVTTCTHPKQGLMRCTSLINHAMDDVFEALFDFNERHAATPIFQTFELMQC